VSWFLKFVGKLLYSFTINRTSSNLLSCLVYYLIHSVKYDMNYKQINRDFFTIVDGNCVTNMSFEITNNCNYLSLPLLFKSDPFGECVVATGFKIL
jgi:hypothetical protein